MEPGPGKLCACTHFPTDPNCDICLKTKITRASCRRRAGTVVPRAESFGDLDNCGSQNSQVTLETITDTQSWYAFRHSANSILSVHNKNFSGDGKESTKILRPVGKAKSHLQ